MGWDGIVPSHPEPCENSLSGTAHLPDFIGQLCRVIKATEIGKESLDLRVLNEPILYSYHFEKLISH
ncbi:unnamed protein product [Rotaria sp. Silwood1]|nr:unnamed protein product [Rotaria sp. Silwood1]